MSKPDRTEVARKNLAKGRAKAARRRKRAKAQKEAERQEQIERIAGPPVKERPRGPWTYKDVSYRTMEGVGVAIAAHHGATQQLEAVGAWASMFTQRKAGK